MFGSARAHPLTKRNDTGMQPELKNGVDPPPRLGLNFQQFIYVFRIEHQRLLANRVSACAKGETHMGVMEIVRRSDRNEIDRTTGTALTIDMCFELLEFGKEAGSGKVAVENANRIIDIHGGDKCVTRLSYRLHMSGRDISSGAN